MGADSVFVSYSRKYSDWTQVLVDNLNRCGVGAFVDDRDIGAGLSWVSRIQRGLDRAGKVVLVATPEALASPRVADEVEALVTAHRDYVGARRLLVAELLTTPLPPFLETIQRVCFVEHDREQYLRAFRELLAGVRGLGSSSEMAPLPPGIAVPDAPQSALSGALRARVVEWAAQGLDEDAYCRLVASAMDQDRLALDGFGSARSAASAALVLNTGDDDAVQAAVRFVELVVDELGKLVPALKKDSPALLEDLTAVLPPDESGLLADYRKQVASDHGNLVPYFRRSGAAAVLDRVYVRLDLRRTEQRTLAEEGKGLVPSKPLCIKGLLSLEADWVTGRWVVKGDPGSGKTTLLRHLAWELCGGDDNPHGWVPLYAPIPALVREDVDPVEREDRRFRRVFGKEGLGQVLEREGRAGRLLVLLDGLDEVPKELRADAESLLRGLGRRWPETPVVVATRPIGYRPLDGGFVEVEVLPLDRARRVEFLARWFAGEGGTPDEARAQAAVNKLSGPLWELSGTPLYLTLMAILFWRGEEPSKNRATLYDQVFTLLLNERHREKPSDEEFPLRPATESALRHLGFSMTEDNRDGESVGDLVLRLYDMEDQRSLTGLERRWDRDLNRFLGELAARTGILGPHDGEGADWRFWHRSFREALAAQKMAERVDAGGLETCLAQAGEVAGDESRWAEPFALLMGRLSEPDRLVRELMERNSALGLRALATAQSVSAETVREVLKLTEDRDERGEVFSDIPRLVEDPERAVYLLERLARQTADGSDLYFIHEAVSRVEAGHPDVERQTKNALCHLYDHLATPDEALFSTVATRDGEVLLWTKVEAGQFVMGSPETEKDRLDWEGPQHRVTITRPFWASVVPVTHGMYEAFDPGHVRDWSFSDKVGAEELSQHPVVNVSWYEAVSFCRWLSARHPTLGMVRLPTEAEWEYLCRAGTATRFWNGDGEADLAKVGWYRGNSDRRTHRVGRKQANPWGLYDVHGNVWEWCSDWFGKYPAEAQTDPEGSESSDVRVVRGGAWHFFADALRAAYRYRYRPADRGFGLGFRAVLRPLP